MANEVPKKLFDPSVSSVHLLDNDSHNVSLFEMAQHQYEFMDGNEKENEKVTLKACCQNRCITFNELASMVGVECCGQEPANIIHKICCKGNLHDRRDGYRYYDRCCNDKPYASDQTCCAGKIHEGAALACCGDAAYDLYSKRKICCGDQLYSVPDKYVTTACCGNMIYNAWDGSEFCCGSKVYSRKSSNACCVSNLGENNEDKDARGYNTQTQICCNGVHDKRDLDACCYVSDASTSVWRPPTPVPYNTRTSYCDVDGVHEINS